MSDEKDTIKTISKASSLKEYLKKCADRHTNFYHYSSIDAIDGILNSGVFWVSSMKYSNDEKEHNAFGDDTYTYFQLCFVTGTTENLPMWFLYSGKNGRGANIGIPRNQINKLIDVHHLDLSLVAADSPDKPVKLSPEDYEAEFNDVLYYKKENNKYRLKHNTNVNNQFPAEEFHQYEKENHGFLKDIVWFYEKETRLLIRVRKEKLDQSLFHGAKTAPYRLELKIPPEIFAKIKVTLSPYYVPDDSGEFEEVLKKTGIQRYIKNTILSEYSGQVHINLCRHCNNIDKAEE